MKLGNVSQTIVEVPKFFFDTTKNIDAFKSQYNQTLTIKNSTKHFYFSKRKNVLYSNLDLNLSNNPRVIKGLDEMNKEIYLPIYKRYSTPNCQSNKEISEENKKTKYSTRYKIIKNYMNYNKKININEKVRPKLREEIMNGTYNLIERINSDYDLTLYSNFDSRSTLNQKLNSRYSIFSESIKHKKSEKELFRKVLSNKINSLRTIKPKVKEILKKLNYKKNMYIEQDENNKNPEIIKSQINKILQNITTNFLRLRYNNKDNYGYNENDQYLIDSKRSLTTRINNNPKSTLFNGFPSKTRMEFTTSKKKILIPKKILNKLIRKNANETFLKKKQHYKNQMYNLLLNDMWYRPLHKDAYKIDNNIY